MVVDCPCARDCLGLKKSPSIGLSNTAVVQLLSLVYNVEGVCPRACTVFSVLLSKDCVPGLELLSLFCPPIMFDACTCAQPSG